MSKNITIDVLGDTKSPLLSKGYEFVDTRKVIDEISKYGYEMVKSAVQPTTNEFLQQFKKHTVAFENRSIEAQNGVIPQLHIINSYDGSTSLRFEFGLLRLVCSNGLIVKDGTTDEIRMAHTNIHTSVENAIKQLETAFNTQQGIISKLMQTSFSKDQAIELAKYAVEQRFGEVREYDYEKFIMPNRYEDSDNNAWSKFNTIQENIIKGNPTITHTTQRPIREEGVIVDYKDSQVKLPELRDWSKSFELNKNLYNKARELAVV